MKQSILGIRERLPADLIEKNLTYSAEGSDQLGKYFSRKIHWPGGASGVTIGRGYDLGDRTKLQIKRELMSVGVSAHESERFARAAGLKGWAARDFVTKHHTLFPEISEQTERDLFTQVTYPQSEQDVKRILEKKDVVRTYGSSSWEGMPARVKNILVDLRYRGDFTHTTRKVLQPLLVLKDWNSLADVMKDAGYWSKLGVPKDRIERRAEYLTNDSSLP